MSPLKKIFPTGPLAIIFLSFSIVKYANPEAPSALAHLSMLSKKLLGLSLVLVVLIHLTFDPDFTNFLKISKDTSSLEKISVMSLIINGFLKSGLSVPYFNKASE